MKRRNKGATLGLTIVCTLVLIAIGAAVMIILMMLGGGRQTISAVDAGSLNVARVAMTGPSIQLDTTDATYGATELTIQNTVLNGRKTVYLSDFNKIVLWGLTVALNAEAANTKTAIANADTVWNTIEGDSTNSIGARLKAAMQSSATNITGNGKDIPTGTWPKAVFENVAQANATGLMNSNAKQTVTWQSFKTTYLGAGESTNVPAAQITNNLPYTDASAGTRLAFTLPTTADGYVQGYMPIYVGQHTKHSYSFMTTYRDQPPSLRTNYEFNNGPTGLPNTALYVPPNTFYNTATITSSVTNTPVQVSSIATVGGKAYGDIYNYGGGYLVFNNSPAGYYKGWVDDGCFLVQCNELGLGIYVLADSTNGDQLFCTDQKTLNAISTWVQGGKKGKPAPDFTGVYNYSDGSAATATTLADDFTAPLPLVVCTDETSDPNNPNEITDCQTAMSPTKDVFNKAYHPAGHSGGVMSQWNEDSIDQLAVTKNMFMDYFLQYAPVSWQVSWWGSAKGHGGHTPVVSLDGYSGLEQFHSDYDPSLASTSSTTSYSWETSTKNTSEPAYGQGGDNYEGSATGDFFGDDANAPTADQIDPDRLGSISKPIMTLGTATTTTNTDGTTTTTVDGIIGQITNTTNYYMYDSYKGKTATSDPTKAPDPATNPAPNAPGSGPATMFYNLFAQRLGQMGAQSADIQKAWNNISLGIGDKVYVYVDNNGKIVTTDTLPASLAALPALPAYTAGTDFGVAADSVASADSNQNGPPPDPDGFAMDATQISVWRGWGALGCAVDSANEYGIHQALFLGAGFHLVTDPTTGSENVTDATANNIFGGAPDPGTTNGVAGKYTPNNFPLLNSVMVRDRITAVLGTGQNGQLLNFHFDRYVYTPQTIYLIDQN